MWLLGNGQCGVMELLGKEMVNMLCCVGVAGDMTAREIGWQWGDVVEKERETHRDRLEM